MAENEEGAEKKGMGLPEIATGAVVGGGTAIASSAGYGKWALGDAPAAKAEYDAVKDAFLEARRDARNTFKANPVSGKTVKQFVTEETKELSSELFSKKRIANGAAEFEKASMMKPWAAFKALPKVGQGAVIAGTAAAAFLGAKAVNSWRNSGQSHVERLANEQTTGAGAARV